MTEESLILLERKDRVAWLTVNRPAALNALSFEALIEMRHHLDALKQNRDIWVVAIRGAGDKAFCAGADLKERKTMDESQVKEFVQNIRGLMDDIASLPQPTVAVIQGHAFGGGCEIALACDLRIIDPEAKIGLTETGLGIIPGAGGCARLPRLVGVARAKEMILLGQRLTAARAEEIGLVHQVADKGKALEEGMVLIDSLLEKAPLALKAAKKAVDGALGKSIEEALRLESECYESIIPTQDRLEALAAFAEKRRPDFQGK